MSVYRSTNLTHEQLEFLKKKIRQYGAKSVAKKLGYAHGSSVYTARKLGKIANTHLPKLEAWMEGKEKAPIRREQITRVNGRTVPLSHDLAEAMWRKLSNHDKAEAMMAYLTAF